LHAVHFIDGHSIKIRRFGFNEDFNFLKEKNIQNTSLKSTVCSWFSDIKPLIGFESSIFELSIFILGNGKREKNPWEVKGPGVGFANGRFYAL